jgi:hypothetical protein
VCRSGNTLWSWSNWNRSPELHSSSMMKHVFAARPACKVVPNNVVVSVVGCLDTATHCPLMHMCTRATPTKAQSVLLQLQLPPACESAQSLPQQGVLHCVAMRWARVPPQAGSLAAASNPYNQCRCSYGNRVLVICRLAFCRELGGGK